MISNSNSQDQLVRTGRIPAGKTDFAIEALEPRQYRLIIMGKGPLQRFGVPVTVGDGATAEVTVRISPAVLDLEVLLGDKPLDGAMVDLSYEGNIWRAEVTTDGFGRAREEIWQRGSFKAFVSRDPLVRYWGDSRDIDEEGTIPWTIRVADRKLRGRVIDEASRQPVGEARVILEWKRADGGAAMMAERSAADGAYEFRAMPVSGYTLRAMKEGYQPLRTPPYALAEETTIETRDLFLRRSSGRPLRVINSSGVPIPSAEVYVDSREGARLVGSTDEQGRLALPIANDEFGTIFVLPRSGSIGFGRFASLTDSRDGEIVIRVPEASVSLEVVAESTTGDPIGGVSIMMRVDGVLVPLAVRTAMTNYQGVPLLTDAHGRLLIRHLPTGHYEIWPLANRDDLLALMKPSPPPAPINVTLTPGHHSAQLKFRPKP